MSNNAGEVVYLIDRNDILVQVNDQWDRFAVHNNSAHLCRQNVIDHSLWTYIQDAATRHVHQTLLSRVRRKRRIRNLPFRCDSPGLRRYMEMDLLPLERGGVEYRCRMIREEARDAVPLMEPKVPPSATGYIRMCSWCKKVDVGHNHWVEIEEAVTSLKLLERDSLPPISHTMCDACLEDLGVEEG